MSTTTQFFPARESALATVLDFVESCARERQLPETLVLKLRLVAEELFTNSVRHGGGLSGGVVVTIAEEDGQVSFVYEDEGPAQDPFAQLDRGHLERPVTDRPVGRLGLVLIDGFAESVNYERRRGRNRLWIRLKPADPGTP